MRYLLDTNIVLWLLAGSPRISAELTDRLTDRSHSVFVSAATGWEIAIKLSIGKLRIPADAQTWFPTELATMGLTELPVTLQHALAVEQLPLLHRDPFDRLLIAQAQAERLVLVSSDRIFRRYDVDLLPV